MRGPLFRLLAGISCTAIAAGTGVVFAAPAHDKSTARQQLSAAEQDRAAQLAAQARANEAAKDAAADAARIAAARLDAAAKLHEAEAETEQAAARVESLARQKRDAERERAHLAADLAPMLPLIARLAVYPAETLLAVPAPPEQAIRGLVVLRGIGRDLEREAEALRRKSAEVDRLERQIAAQAPQLAAAEATQAAQADALDRAFAAARSSLHDAADTAAGAARRAAEDAARAETLRGAIGRIEQAEQADAARAARRKGGSPKAVEPGAGVALAASSESIGAPGAGVAPVAGTLVRAFGASTDAGPAAGMSFEAPPKARVVSPCAGRVVFSGPFRSYGRLLIISCGKGYDFVLAGLDKLDAPVGRKLEAGEPVGVMPDWDPRTPGPRPLLYVELRKAGEAVDPKLWLRAKG